MSDETTVNQPTTDQPASEGAVQVNDPQGDVTVNTGGQDEQPVENVTDSDAASASDEES